MVSHPLIHVHESLRFEVAVKEVSKKVWSSIVPLTIACGNERDMVVYRENFEL